MSSNQNESMKANQTKPNITLNDNHNQDNNTIIIWEYERKNVMYFPSWKEEKYDVDVI